MTITNTTILDLVPNEKVLGQTVDLLIQAKNELVTSGLAARGPEVNAVASGGPRKGSLPFLNPLSTAEVNIGTDNINQQGNVGKLTAQEFSVLRHDLNYGWGTADLARMATTYDAKGGIQAGIAQYWNGIFQKLATSSIKGILGVDAGLTFGTGTDDLDMGLYIDAMATAGVYADLFNVAIISPKTKAKWQKQNQIPYVPATETDLGLDMIGGQLAVIVSTEFGDDTTVLARTGGLAFGTGVPAGLVPFEVERLANAGNGQGADILHSRQSVVCHPQGFNYTGEVSPSFAALETSSNWALSVPVAQVGFRFVKHTA